jgi:hypothetical protein
MFYKLLIPIYVPGEARQEKRTEEKRRKELVLF